MFCPRLASASPKLGRCRAPCLHISNLTVHASRPRHLSTAVEVAVVANASEAADRMMHGFGGKTLTRKQTLDGNQLQKLSLTLGRTHLRHGLDVSTNIPPLGTPLPPGYHLVYFTPSELESALGPDGTERTFNAPAPFTRRMWAGGRMRWHHDATLRVGEMVEEHTKLVGVTAKKSRDGSDMVIVDVEKEFWGERGLSIADQRSWVFRKEAVAPVEASPELLSTSFSRSEVRDVKSGTGKGFPERHLRWSPVALFRFSALTFNGHMIHYNETRTRNFEGHPGLVVHGPLNLINMMDYWRDFHGKENLHAKEVAYRAMSPIYAGEPYKITSSVVDRSEDGGHEPPRVKLLVENGGVVSMRAEVVAHTEHH
ncbi:hypothetical protein B0T22DRAFT_371066 [Podospora appendiculata]|uniref:FAS1-like dehydratase domain-containing protein n=1 Tax=Podospora appendiculata TaxID=314037 RepID=A0AAE1CHD1_9PEZI|nr:hypothetical protein B0T22DRAFT_371066 [Podospora appendiculata]